MSCTVQTCVTSADCFGLYFMIYDLRSLFYEIGDNFEISTITSVDGKYTTGRGRLGTGGGCRECHGIEWTGDLFQRLSESKECVSVLPTDGCR